VIVGSERGARAAWLFLAPALVVYAGFALLPILEAGGLSLCSWNQGQARPSWLGPGNYAEAFSDGVFWRAVLNNLLLAALSVAVQLPVALALAAMLAAPLRGRWLFRTVYFAPMVLPTVVIAFFWRYFLLDPEDGLANAALRLAGAGGADWLGDPRLAFGAVFSAVSWKHIGFHTIILLAGVLAIPGGLYEAATIDGAGAWGRFRHVTLPGVAPVLGVCALLAVIGSLKYFDLVYVMTRGGPDHATELGATWVYAVGVEARRVGYGCALAVVLLVVSLLAAALVMKIRRGAQPGGGPA
jgi:raffinose/stachyose/melibiose transport system permease protein